MQEQEKREIPVKIRRPVASSGAIPTCENLGATSPQWYPMLPEAEGGEEAALAIQEGVVDVDGISVIAVQWYPMLPEAEGGEEAALAIQEGEVDVDGISFIAVVTDVA
ncbi:hypothetical protein PR048_029877 [Dryococelus australis]|uniref:Uncharacterized protein n=1 Tax=Dryococelus australis TaxID=614101 RepID=A0ABQ9GA11_9NEOP|nr:hypothetical protein PR048_029877 [Dryococelus australis]